jgi:transmembrane sensor
MSDIDDQALEWVARQSARELEPDEQARFEAWFAAHPRHQGAYLRARAIQHSLGQLTVQHSLRPSAEHLKEEREAEPEPVAAPRRGFMLSGALAAGLAAVSAGVLLPRLFGQTEIRTAKGEFRKVPLADQSVATINSASHLEVQMEATRRRILLKQGEAWFDVAKDKTKPFIVEAGAVRVRAVGTAFGVRRHKGGAEVFVTEGVVEVWSDAGSAGKRQLVAGEHAYVAQEAAAIEVAAQPDEVERRLAWRDGKLVFQNEPLSEAVADFNRYNTRQIVIADPALARKPLVGQYRIDEPELFADDVRALLNVPVTITEDQIQIGAATVRGRVHP